MHELKLERALELAGGRQENPSVWIRLSSNGEGSPASPMSYAQALEKYAGWNVAKIRPAMPDGLHYAGMVLDVEPPAPAGTPRLFVCVEGGIVNDVYAKGLDGEIDLYVLDVDSDRDDAEPIQESWDAIAARPDEYRRLDPSFYAPLDGDDPLP